MGTRIELFTPEKKWVPIGYEVKPGMPPASFSDNSTEQRQIYSISCSEDEHFTYVERSVGGVDLDNGPVRIFTTEGLERIATLKDGSDPFELSILTDRIPQAIRIRVLHRNTE